MEYEILSKACDLVLNVAKTINKMVKTGYNAVTAQALDEQVELIEEISKRDGYDRPGVKFGRGSKGRTLVAVCRASR